MRKLQKYLLICLISSAFFIISCAVAKTTINAVRNPNVDIKPLKKILVLSSFDSGTAKIFEDFLAEKLQDYNVQIVSGIFFNKELMGIKDEEMFTKKFVDLIKQYKEKYSIDSILFITLEEYHERKGTIYVPKSQSGYGDIDAFGNIYWHSYTYGGYYIPYSMPEVSFSLDLYSIDGRIIWTGTALTTGNAYTSGTKLIQSLADNLVKRLFNDNLI